ncbi:N-acetyltransferase [Vannielia sp.]|uniref:GNAT family N-acetyltransferase n=1 Tax=Vannielia sp. TaxID=2813045 RepID=UPI00261DE5F7|nr:GNAT family N-acetyltransferase [Vannielia sp.]MDF1873586.1 GNAT family N-acetyltransferase [Vannielia sp.]
MSQPQVAALLAAIDGTWPAEHTHTAGAWTIRKGAGGGSRVSAATTLDENAPLAPMEEAQRALGQPPLVRLMAEQTQLEARLAAAGYALKDPTNIYSAPVARMAIAPPSLTAFRVDLPALAIQRQLWAEGGIGPERQAIMARVQGPKTTILARAGDSPAGVAFIALHGDIAMLHALEVRPADRRQGVGRNIMGAAAIWAQDHGARWLTLLVTQGNAAANALYTRLEMDFCTHYMYRIKQVHKEAANEEETGSDE